MAFSITINYFELEKCTCENTKNLMMLNPIQKWCNMIHGCSNRNDISRNPMMKLWGSSEKVNEPQFSQSWNDKNHSSPNLQTSVAGKNSLASLGKTQIVIDVNFLTT